MPRDISGILLVGPVSGQVILLQDSASDLGQGCLKASTVANAQSGFFCLPGCPSVTVRFQEGLRSSH